MQRASEEDQGFNSGPNHGPKTHVTGTKSNTTGPTTLGGTRKKYAPREFQDRFVDKPDYVSRGQNVEFLTANQAKPEKSQSRSPPRQNLRGGIMEEVTKQTSSHNVN